MYKKVWSKYQKFSMTRSQSSDWMVVGDKTEKSGFQFMKGFLSKDRELRLYAKGYGMSSMSFKSESDIIKF